MSLRTDRQGRGEVLDVPRVWEFPSGLHPFFVIKCRKKIMRLSLTSCVLLVLLGGFVEAQRDPQETWVNPGVGPGATSDIQVFVQKTDAAFVGVLEDVSVNFVDDRHGALFTTLRFLVSDWLYNKAKHNESVVDLLVYGGTFTERGGQRFPKRPAEIAEHLTIGTEYFVPIKYANAAVPAVKDRPLLAATDVVTELRADGHVATVQPHSRWAEGILAKAQTMQPVPGTPSDDRTRFIAAIRSAGGHLGIHKHPPARTN